MAIKLKYSLIRDKKFIRNVEKLISEGLIPNQIARKLKVSSPTIFSIIKENNIKNPNSTPKLKIDMSDPNNISAVSDYNNGVSYIEICKKYNVNYVRLKCLVKKFKVEKQKLLNPPKPKKNSKEKIIVEKIKFLAAENLTIAGIARVVKFTLTSEQLDYAKLDVKKIEKICKKHKITTKKGKTMKHITNNAFQSYTELWQSIFPDHYQDKYQHSTGLSGGGGDYPFYDVHLKQDVVLLPEYKFVLASSIEKFNVPNDWYLVTGNKSSIARQGVDASFNTYIDNGFQGFLTIEIVNHNPNKTVTLIAGQPILKVEARRCEFNAKPYQGKYQNQPNKPVGAK